MTDHPLDPADPGRVPRGSGAPAPRPGLLRRWRIASIELREPSKEVIASTTPPAPISRGALVVCWNRDDGRVYKATLSLTDDRVLSWDEVAGEQPNATVDEWHEARRDARRHPR